jgi:hypothetical protein
MIVCLGWGSLIWRPEELALVDSRPEAWRNDGPELPIEFLRQSQNGCLTLVIDANVSGQPVLWSPLAVRSLAEAVETLQNREGTSSKLIGRWPDERQHECAEVIGKWAKHNGLEGVVWTALGCKFDGKSGRRPTLPDAITYLNTLEGEPLLRAEQYIRRAPRQIDTAYRRAFIREFGWTQFDPDQ